MFFSLQYCTSSISWIHPYCNVYFSFFFLSKCTQKPYAITTAVDNNKNYNTHNFHLICIFIKLLTLIKNDREKRKRKECLKRRTKTNDFIFHSDPEYSFMPIMVREYRVGFKWYAMQTYVWVYLEWNTGLYWFVNKYFTRVSYEMKLKAFNKNQYCEVN